jgi:hypothetical protein
VTAPFRPYSGGIDTNPENSPPRQFEPYLFDGKEHQARFDETYRGPILKKCAILLCSFPLSGGSGGTGDAVSLLNGVD